MKPSDRPALTRAMAAARCCGAVTSAATAKVTPKLPEAKPASRRTTISVGGVSQNAVAALNTAVSARLHSSTGRRP